MKTHSAAWLVLGLLSCVLAAGARAGDDNGVGTCVSIGDRSYCQDDQVQACRSDSDCTIDGICTPSYGCVYPHSP
jgi:hypothetical protein